MGEPEPGQVHLFNRYVLSDREAQVVRLLLTGHGVPTIARLLFISQVHRPHPPIRRVPQAAGGLAGRADSADLRALA